MSTEIGYLVLTDLFNLFFLDIDEESINKEIVLSYIKDIGQLVFYGYAQEQLIQLVSKIWGRFIPRGESKKRGLLGEKPQLIISECMHGLGRIGLRWTGQVIFEKEIDSPCL